MDHKVEREGKNRSRCFSFHPLYAGGTRILFQLISQKIFLPKFLFYKFLAIISTLFTLHFTTSTRADKPQSKGSFFPSGHYLFRITSLKFKLCYMKIYKLTEYVSISY